MKESTLIASRLREVLLNGKWIANTNFKDQLSDLTWEQATTQIASLNTIAALTFHIDYYMGGVIQVLEGGPLEIRDKYSFDMPPITSQENWEILKDQFERDAETISNLIEQLTDEQLEEVFVEEKYGYYHRNLEGMIEHAYYHLGQVVLIKKMILESAS